jgi:hypothetical protein
MSGRLFYRGREAALFSCHVAFGFASTEEISSIRRISSPSRILRFDLLSGRNALPSAEAAYAISSRQQAAFRLFHSWHAPRLRLLSQQTGQKRQGF